MKIDTNSNAYKEQLEYFSKNYGAEYRTEQGTEQILDMISLFSKPGSLIDFGSGSNIYFWLLAMSGIKDVTCVDISQEAFYINEQIRNKILYPKSFNVVSEKYDVNIDEILRIKPRYVIKDIFKEFLSIEKLYNNVCQFGLLGLSENKNEYKRRFFTLWKYLKPDGVFMGANWIFSDLYSEKKGFSNKYLNCEIINEIANECNGVLLENRLIAIKNDVNYNNVLIYTMVK